MKYASGLYGCLVFPRVQAFSDIEPFAMHKENGGPFFPASLRRDHRLPSVGFEVSPYIFTSDLSHLTYLRLFQQALFMPENDNHILNSLIIFGLRIRLFNACGGYLLL